MGCQLEFKDWYKAAVVHVLGHTSTEGVNVGRGRYLTLNRYYGNGCNIIQEHGISHSSCV